MDQITYTQEQVNVMCKSYEIENSKLLALKANLELQAFNLKKSIQVLGKKNLELTDEIAALKKPKEVPKKKK